MDPVIGQIMLWPGTFAPQGWFYCNGQTLQITQYQALFSIIGTYYGGNGTSTFQLPDFRSRAPLGASGANGMGGGALPAGLTAQNLGTLGGSESETLTIAQIPAHTHPYGPASMPALNGGLACSAQGASSQAPGMTSVPAALPDNNGSQPAFLYGPSDNVTTIPVNVTAGGSITLSGNTGASVGGAAHENRQPFQACSYLICWSGVYPTRP